MKKPDYSFQDDFAKKIITLAELGNNEIGICLETGCTKTETSLKVQKHFLINESTLTLTHGRDELRSNYAKKAIESKTTKNCNVKVIVSRKNKTHSLADYYITVKELDDLDITKNYMFITLPQTIAKNAEVLNRFRIKRLFVDESQDYYFAEMVINIKSKLNILTNFLITASTSKINQRKIPKVTMCGMEGFERGIIQPPQVQLAEARYSYGSKDYGQDQSHLKENYSWKEDETYETLKSIIINLYSFPNKLFKTKPSWQVFSKVIPQFFKSLDSKTMFVSASINHAKQIEECLINKIKISSKNILNASSKDDPSNENLEKFLTGDEKILITVNRGRIGYDHPDLDVVDMSGTLDPQEIKQIIGRTVRISTSKKQKIFLKVVPEEIGDIAYEAMSFALALWLPEYFDTYEGNFKTKIPIPKSYLEYLKKNKEICNKTLNKVIKIADTNSILLSISQVRAIARKINKLLLSDKEILDTIISYINKKEKTETIFNVQFLGYELMEALYHKRGNYNLVAFTTPRLIRSKHDAWEQELNEKSDQDILLLLKEKAKDCVREVFRRNYGGLCNYLSRKNKLYLLDEVFNRLKKSITFEEAIKIAKQYKSENKTLTDFRNNEQSAVARFEEVDISLLYEIIPQKKRRMSDAEHIERLKKSAREFVQKGGTLMSEFKKEYSKDHVWACSNGQLSIARDIIKPILSTQEATSYIKISKENGTITKRSDLTLNSKGRFILRLLDEETLDLLLPCVYDMNRNLQNEIKEASKYSSKAEYRKNNPNGLHWLEKYHKKDLDKIFSK